MICSPLGEDAVSYSTCKKWFLVVVRLRVEIWISRMKNARDNKKKFEDEELLEAKPSHAVRFCRCTWSNLISHFQTFFINKHQNFVKKGRELSWALNFTFYANSSSNSIQKI